MGHICRPCEGLFSTVQLREKSAQGSGRIRPVLLDGGTLDGTEFVQCQCFPFRPSVCSKKFFFFSKPHRDLFRKLCEIRIGHILVKTVNLNHHHCDGM